VKRRIAIAGATLAFVSAATAQTAPPPNYHEMSFDLWCQEEQNLPPKRCDKRLPQDDAAYRAYLDLNERYETQKLNNDARERRIQRMIQNGSPMDQQAVPATPHPQ
jgi:hypothetical protein